jgi:hypothetical protein
VGPYNVGWEASGRAGRSGLVALFKSLFLCKWGPRTWVRRGERNADRWFLIDRATTNSQGFSGAASCSVSTRFSIIK